MSCCVLGDKISWQGPEGRGSTSGLVWTIVRCGVRFGPPTLVLRRGARPQRSEDRTPCAIPQNVGHEWQRVRDALGIPEDVTAHSFRGAVATILDDAGLSARVTADVLMHVDPAMTQRHYMARGRAHQAAADALDRAVGGQG
ncbi:tyrosine-type recombinase/integrase [Nocardia arthritidis]|uniref:Tyrosine-type recombinase/integrase n=1 Tax=Nocardia arthritidis TaxID=228602 RepID=A0A6G9YRH1_9NOCA|nr:tyrosine-type recombinase/integrase [Nocardia arthritidis]